MTGKTRAWKSGVADETWKIFVCARDAEKAREILSGLAYILDNPGMTDEEGYADVIRRFSGEQIADALLAYRASALQSIENGLAAGSKKATDTE